MKNKLKTFLILLLLLFSFRHNLALGLLYAQENKDENQVLKDEKEIILDNSQESSTSLPPDKEGEEDFKLKFQTSSKESSSTKELLRLVLSLAVILLLLYSVYRLFKRSGKTAQEDSTVLKLASSVCVGNGKYVKAVVVGTKAYLIGVSEHSINLIAEIDDKLIIDILDFEAQKAISVKQDFASLLSAIFKNAKKEKPFQKGNGLDETGSVNDEFFASQRERLNTALQNKGGEEKH